MHLSGAGQVGCVKHIEWIHLKPNICRVGKTIDHHIPSLAGNMWSNNGRIDWHHLQIELVRLSIFISMAGSNQTNWLTNCVRQSAVASEVFAAYQLDPQVGAHIHVNVVIAVLIFLWHVDHVNEYHVMQHVCGNCLSTINNPHYYIPMHYILPMHVIIIADDLQIVDKVYSFTYRGFPIKADLSMATIGSIRLVHAEAGCNQNLSCICSLRL